MASRQAHLLQAVRSISKRARTIAVVGNGPLSDLQRSQIAVSDIVIRFNKLNNRQALWHNNIAVQQHCACAVLFNVCMPIWLMKLHDFAHGRFCGSGWTSGSYALRRGRR